LVIMLMVSKLFAMINPKKMVIEFAH